MNISNAYNDVLYNSQIDLSTHMPIIVLPIRYNHNMKIAAILEIINGRGIEGLSSTNKSKIGSVDFEFLEFFS